MGKPTSEPNGTGSDTIGGGGGDALAIDPASLVPGSGAGTGDGNGDGGTGDDGFERDDAGNIKRNRDGSPRRKRGRKSGSNSGTGFASSTKAKGKDDLKRSIDALSNILLVSHLGLSGVTNIPEIALEKDDADLLANAAVPVLEQFDFTPDPRFVAVFGLIMACGKVYGPRAYLYRVRKENERAENAKPVGGFEVGA
jgi:hypothetical protein